MVLSQHFVGKIPSCKMVFSWVRMLVHGSLNLLEKRSNVVPFSASSPAIINVYNGTNLKTRAVLCCTFVATVDDHHFMRGMTGRSLSQARIAGAYIALRIQILSEDVLLN